MVTLTWKRSHQLCPRCHFEKRSDEESGMRFQCVQDSLLLQTLRSAQGDMVSLDFLSKAIHTTTLSMDSKMKRPSVPPRAASQHRSGWGIMPSTLPRSLIIPAMFSSEPFGLASSVTSP